MIRRICDEVHVFVKNKITWILINVCWGVKNVWYGIGTWSSMPGLECTLEGLDCVPLHLQSMHVAKTKNMGKRMDLSASMSVSASTALKKTGTEQVLPC